jgi:hypothetical protein
MAAVIAVWIIGAAAREIGESQDELISPEKIVCAHSD